MLPRLIPRDLPGTVDRAIGGALAAGLRGPARPAAALVTQAHLTLDAASAAVLATSPSLAGVARAGRRYWLPHVAVGALEVARAASTTGRPGQGGR